MLSILERKFLTHISDVISHENEEDAPGRSPIPVVLADTRAPNTGQGAPNRQNIVWRIFQLDLNWQHISASPKAEHETQRASRGRGAPPEVRLARRSA